MYYISSLNSNSVGVVSTTNNIETLYPYFQLDSMVMNGLDPVIGYNWGGAGRHIVVNELIAVLCSIDIGVPIVLTISPCDLPKQCIYLGRKGNLFCFYDGTYFELSLSYLQNAPILYSMNNIVSRVVELFAEMHKR